MWPLSKFMLVSVAVRAQNDSVATQHSDAKLDFYDEQRFAVSLSISNRY
jgi:hypothetical protein